HVWLPPATVTRPPVLLPSGKKRILPPFGAMRSLVVNSVTCRSRERFCGWDFPHWYLEFAKSSTKETLRLVITASLRAERSAAEIACAAARPWVVAESGRPLMATSEIMSPKTTITTIISISVKPAEPLRKLQTADLEREVIEAQHRD